MVNQCNLPVLHLHLLAVESVVLLHLTELWQGCLQKRRCMQYRC